MEKMIKRFSQDSRRINSPFKVLSAGYIEHKDYFLKITFDTLNFSFILAGTGKFFWKGRFITIHAPCVMVQPPHVQLQFGPMPGKTWTAVHFVLPPKTLSYVKSKKLWDGDYPLWEIQNIRQVLVLADQLKKTIRTPNPMIDLDRLDSLCEQLLIESVLPVDQTSEPLNADLKQQVSPYYDAIHEIHHDMIAQQDTLDLQHYAQKYKLSVPTLRRHWLKVFGISPKQFQIDLVIREACRLLTKTHMDIQAIAESLNYSEQFYFSKQFKKITGYSPTQYRRLFSSLQS
jgi:AraC-like DNA-binding protein